MQKSSIIANYIILLIIINCYMITFVFGKNDLIIPKMNVGNYEVTQ